MINHSLHLLLAPLPTLFIFNPDGIYLYIDLPLLSSTIHHPPFISNTHYMSTRSKQGIFKPKAYLFATILPEPSTIKEVLSIYEWKLAMQSEFNH